MTAFNDENGNQVVYPDSPVGFVYSTSASNTDPLQKDFMMDLDFLTLNDPITFGDVVTLNGEPTLEFVDTSLEEVSFYTVGDNIYTYVKYPAGNTTSGVDSINVTVTNPSTGDDEQLTLYESTPTSGLFTNNGGATKPVSLDVANSWIPAVTTSATTPSATWTLTYDSISSTWLIDDGTTSHTAVTAGTEYTSDGGEVTFTLYEISPANLDTITFTTYPADPLLSVADDSSPNNSDNSDSLEVASGDTIQFSYTTPNAETYTTETNIVGDGVPFIEFTRANGLPSTNFQLTNDPDTSDQIYVTVTHPLSNTDPSNPDSFTVYLTGDNDSESITLTETGDNTGIFRNTTGLLTQVYDGTPVAGTLEDIDEGTVTATYTYNSIPYSTTTQLFYVNGAGRVYFTNASGTEDVELYVAGQTVFITVEDKNNTASSSVQVTVTSPTSGDSESVILYETSSGSGVFTNGVHSNRPTDLATTSSSAVVTSASSTFISDGVQSGDTFTIFSGPDAGDYTILSVDSETQITLTTTLGNTGTGLTFTAEQLLTTATLSGGTTDDDGILELVHDETLQVSYEDTVAANGSDDGDSSASNDFKTDTGTYKAPPVVINEVFFFPIADILHPDYYEGQTEYFQVYNASGSSINIAGYTVTDGDTFNYTFPEAPDESGTGLFTLDPGEKAYILIYDSDLSAYNYYDSGTDINYLFADSGVVGQPTDQFGDPDDASSGDRADQLLLYNTSSEIQDYVGWSYVLEPSVDFLGDDSPAVTDSIWQDDAFLDVSSIAEGYAISRISDGYDTDVPSDWTYPVDPSWLWATGGPVVTPVIISSFEAYDDYGRVLLQWETAYENGTVGFYIFRKARNQFMYELVNKKLIPALIGSPQGGSYRFYDEGARAGKTYSYLLEEVVETGERIEYGPFTVKAERRAQGQRFYGSFIREQRAPSVASLKRQKLKDKTKNFRRGTLRKKSSAKTNKRNGRYLNAGNPNQQPDTLKISTIKPGLYFIDGTEIAYHFNLSQSVVAKLIKHGNLALSSQGQSVPYFVDHGNQGIYFYGFAYNDIYTDVNVFWLSINSGRIMKTARLARPQRLFNGQSYLDTIHFEEDLWPTLSQPWKTTDDYWVWDYALSGYTGMDFLTFNFAVNDVAVTSASANLILHFVGGSLDGAGIDHMAEVSLNGSRIGDCVWQGIDLLDCDLQFPQNLLNEGDNLLEIQGVLIGGGGFSLFYVDSFDVHYNRYYNADENSLQLRGDDNRTVSIFDFDSNNIFLLDVTNPYEPELVKNTHVTGLPGSGYQLSFSPESPDAEYLAVAASALKSPLEIAPYTYSGLKKRRNRADYLIISPAELTDAAQELADYRARQGYTVKTVSLEKVINEFNDGIYSPLAIKKFLAHTLSKWRMAPEFVVFIGDATYDYKDVQGYGGNMLPTIFVPTPNGLYASDNYLVDVDDDNVPDMAVGRLPVLTAEELHTVIEKIKDYETLAGFQKNKVLLLADESGDNVNFSTDSDRISRLIPDSYALKKIYLSDYPLNVARQKLFTELNEGAAVVNYIGHAGTDRIAQNGLLKSTDVDTLSSVGSLPIITAMTCVLGEFIFPSFDTLGELLLLQPNGGATAVWTASGLSENDEARLLDSEFYIALYRDGESILGKAINKAFYEYSLKGEEPYHISIYNLLGDPALKVY
jgi:hypothetical protein